MLKRVCVLFSHTAKINEKNKPLVTKEKHDLFYIKQLHRVPTHTGNLQLP